MDRASATEMIGSGSVPGQVKAIKDYKNQHLQLSCLTFSDKKGQREASAVW